MSFATDMLAKAQAAYSSALDAGASVGAGDKRLQNYEIDTLRKQVEYWQAKVDAEAGRSAGTPSRRPFQAVL